MTTHLHDRVHKGQRKNIVGLCMLVSSDRLLRTLFATMSIALGGASLLFGQASVKVAPATSGPTSQSMRILLTPQTPPERVKDLLFSTMTTKCAVPGSASPTTFILFPYDDRKFFSFGGMLIEYRGTWSKLLPQLLSPADRLNGLQYQGIAMLGAAAIRHFKLWDRSERSVWSSWLDATQVPIPRSFDDLSVPDLVPTVVIIERKNNQWSFRMPKGVEPFDPDSFTAARRQCEALMKADPRTPK